MVGTMTLLLTTCGGLLLLWGHMNSSPNVPTRIAFVGNSFQFVNDFPRFMEALSTSSSQHIELEQDSVLHGNLSLVSLLTKGNGMRVRWTTEQAWNETWGVYEVGACTVRQLLLGRDEYLSSSFMTENNENGDDDQFDDDDDDDSYYYYTNDGFNPCFSGDESDVYYQYTLETKTINNNNNNKTLWDYIVLNDQSIAPAVPRKRNKTIQALISTYIPLLQQMTTTTTTTTTTTSGASPIPIFISTYGYWRDNLNLTDLYGIQNVPHFTAKLEYGYQLYAQTLLLRSSSASSYSSFPSRVAPVGIAFLVVWEENPSLWARLFGPDQFHPSPLGTYLMGCVVHATIFRRLPDAPMKKTTTTTTTTTSISTTSASSFSVNDLFAHSRAMGLTDDDYLALVLPTRDEALYLRWIAKRVVLRGYRPPSFRQGWKLVEQEEGELR
jgi:hypothetical protein